VEVRKASLRDEKELIALRIEYLEEEKQVEDRICMHLKRMLPLYFYEHLNRDLFIYLACEKEKIMGAVFLQIGYRPNSDSFPNGKIGTVLNVYVRKEYRRKNIATKMMEFMIQDAKSRKLDCLELKATRMGEEMYRKIGFEEEAEPYLRMKYLLN